MGRWRIESLQVRGGMGVLDWQRESILNNGSIHAGGAEEKGIVFKGWVPLGEAET